MIELQKLDKTQLAELIKLNTTAINCQLKEQAQKACQRVYAGKVYLRGLIEISSYCQNNCYYCGIASGNKNAERYRLSATEILACCQTGSDLGFSTFVLQGGEDLGISDLEICRLVAKIKANYPGCAITLSLGEKSKNVYTDYFHAGADRYLLRHETASTAHYQSLHPANMSLITRKQCLYDLKEIGFQVGAGFMVGSPLQTPQTLAEDLLFLQELQPQMVGIGPFIPHKHTRFKDYPQGSLNLTLNLISMVRLLLPKALMPATTALGTINNQGRELGLQHGANVVMPNLSPVAVRKKYDLYDGKICVNEAATECITCLSRRVKKAGFTLDFSRGDHVDHF